MTAMTVVKLLIASTEATARSRAALNPSPSREGSLWHTEAGTVVGEDGGWLDQPESLAGALSVGNTSTVKYSLHTAPFGLRFGQQREERENM